MAASITGGAYDVVVHAAAVSDYEVAGIYAPKAGTQFDPSELARTAPGGSPRLVDTTAGKVKSQHSELWLRLQPAPKLVDRIRSAWGFGGVLVKFKLEVAVGEVELLDIAERSRRQSDVNLMVANTLEGMLDWAYLGPGQCGYERVPRGELPERLIEIITPKSGVSLGLLPSMEGTPQSHLGRCSLSSDKGTTTS
jgi:phosphopantothenate-cysteine ligase/phosphopantothenoylcysteine decarboxylase/phosphopantothenate--cysteine ligase